MNQDNEQFKALVLSKGNNKSAIARKLGVSSTLIGQYIQQRHKPKSDFFDKWQEVYGEDIKHMFKTNVSRETSKEKKQAGTWLEMRLNVIEGNQKVILEKLEMLLSGQPELSNLPADISEVEVVREYKGKPKPKGKKRTSKKKRPEKKP